MGRPTDWHVLDFDKDPTPGDPTQVDVLARRLKDFADDVGDALRSVKGLKGDSAVQSWTGLAGDEYRSQFDGIPGELEKLERSYRMCGDALAAYWPKLQQAQGDADRALEQGRQAKADLATAQNSLDSANDWVKRANDQAKKYQEDPKPGAEPPSDADVKAASRNATNASGAQRDASAAVDSAQGRLDAAKQLAVDARKLREDEAGKAKNAIDDASDAGIQNKKWYEKAVDWVIDHWDEIVAVCKIVVAVLGVIVMIIGGPLAWIVLAAALVVLADTLIKYAQGKASLWDVAFAALDCIPGMKGLTTAGGLLKMAKGGLTGLKGGLKGISGALRGLGGGLRRQADDLAAAARRGDARPPCGDPVDPITGDVFMQTTDVTLPGVLPLVLRRTHIASYRSGAHFGPNWASTLDQRLEVDAEGVCYASDDGSTLVYPVPAPDTDTFPLKGPRRPLTWDGTPGGELCVADPQTGQTLHFATLGSDRQPDPDTGAVTLPLTAVSDRNGNRIDFDRDALDTPTEIRHSGGYRIGVRSRDGLVTELRLLSDPGEPVLIRFGYSALGRLTEVTNSSGLPLRLAYDAVGRLLSWTGRDDATFRYVYDETGRCSRTHGPDGFLDATFDYDSEDRATIYTNSLGGTTTYRYNELLQTTSQTDPLGNTTHSTWDVHDRLLSTTDVLGRTTRFAYDETGNVVEVTRPDGSTSSVERDSMGLPVTVVDFLGARWSQEYDDRGNPVSCTDPLGARTVFHHDSLGALTEVTDALGNPCRYDVDAAGLPVAVTDADGATTTYRRDAFGRVVSVTDPVGGTTELTWTVEGQPKRRKLADGSVERWSWDAEGSLRSHTDLAGGTTRFEVGHFDLITSRTDPMGARQEFVYDTELRLVAVVNPQGLTWTYEYDAVGNLLRETDFNGATRSYEYDPANRVTSRTNGAGQTTRYGYDVLGNMTEQRSGEEVATFSYDASGRMVAASNDAAEVTLERDPIGHVVAEACNGRVITSVFDLLGRRTERRTPADSLSVWEYAFDHRVTALRTAGQTLEFGYDAARRETERRFGAVTLSQSWDVRHQLTGQTLTVGEVAEVPSPSPQPQRLQQRSYSYRSDGYLSAVDDLLAGASRFDLDPVGQVTAVRGRGAGESYAYDEGGNQVRATWAAGPGPGNGSGSEAAGDREYHGTLTRRAGRTHYRYDAQGRVVRRTRKLLSGGTRSWEYTWDADDRLTRVTTPDGRRWRYLYDPLGRRIAKELTGDDGSALERTEFVWDGTRLAEQTGTGESVTWEWAPGSHRPLSQLHRGPLADADQDEFDERFYAIVTDLVGTPTELVEADGRLVRQGRTSLWGTPSPETSLCPLRFPGQYFDEETLLHYNLFRYYDPEIARYCSPDPLGLAPAPNDYAYVPNPQVWSDPLGLARCPHYADVSVHGPNGDVRVEYSLRSGNQTPAEQGLGFPNGSMASHTENRAGRMSGGSPTVPIPNDPYANVVPVGPGDSVVISGTKPPCPQCQGAMNRAAEETGANFVYMWGNGNWWQAGNPLG